MSHPNFDAIREAFEEAREYANLSQARLREATSAADNAERTLRERADAFAEALKMEGQS